MKKCFLLAIAMLLLAGCATHQQPQKTQLQLRQFQTRVFQAETEKMVLKAMANVLQDEGFIIEHVNTDIGILKAVKEIDVENSNEAFWGTFLAGHNATWSKNRIIASSVNVTGHGKGQFKVRVIFQSKILNNKGGIVEVKQIDDEKYYQEFFAKVDKSIYLAKEKM